MLRSLAFWVGMVLFAGLVVTGIVMEFAGVGSSSLRRTLLAALGVLLVIVLAVVLIDVVGGGLR